MTLKKRVATLGVAMVFVLGVSLHPAPVRADTEEAFILAGVAIAAYVAFLVIGTSMAYPDGPVENYGGNVAEFAPGTGEFSNNGLDDYLARHARERDRIQFGPRCARPGGQLTLVCW
jgi:hypothetical protein